MLLDNRISKQGEQRGYEGQSVRGKAVVVIGGATEAGRATARLLVARGARVFLTARDPAELSAVLKDVCQWGSEVHGTVVNLGQPGEVRRVFEEAERRLGRIDILVNYLSEFAGETGLDLETCQVQCMQEGIERMQRRTRGHILNVVLPVLQAGPIPVTGRAAPNSLTPALRRQAHELGIRVTLIETGRDAGRISGAATAALTPDDIAECVYDSIIQPFRVDVVFLPGKMN